MELPDFHCTFCGRSQTDVQKLITGPRVFICDACVSGCMDVLVGGALATFKAGTDVEFAPSGVETPLTIKEYRSKQASYPGAYPERCSFCCKGRQDVQVTVRGYMDCICCECVEVSAKMLEEDLPAQWTPKVQSWQKLSRAPA